MSEEKLLREKRDWVIPQTYDWKEIRSQFNIDFEILNYIKTSIKSDNQKNLEDILNESISYIRNLPQDWDDDNAPKFKEETIRRTSELVREICHQIWEAEIEIPPPKIQHTSNGSIDINWESEKFELLINIPDDIDKSVNFFGEHLGHPEDDIANRMNYVLVLEMIISWLKKIHALMR